MRESRTFCAEKRSVNDSAAIKFLGHHFSFVGISRNIIRILVSRHRWSKTEIITPQPYPKDNQRRQKAETKITLDSDSPNT